MQAVLDMYITESNRQTRAVRAGHVLSTNAPNLRKCQADSTKCCLLHSSIKLHDGLSPDRLSVSATAPSLQSRLLAGRRARRLRTRRRPRHRSPTWDEGSLSVVPVTVLGDGYQRHLLEAIGSRVTRPSTRSRDLAGGVQVSARTYMPARPSDKLFTIQVSDRSDTVDKPQSWQ